MKGVKPMLALLPVMICYILSLDKPFFWDTMHLASAQANWFHEHGLSSLLLPDEFDSGHPPLTGWLLALTWKLLGKGLIQSHLMMLPFLVIALWQMMLILRHYFPEEYGYLAFLFFLNPILLTQAMLVSPDIILFAGFFLTLHGILSKRDIKILAGSIILATVSLRGMSCVAALAVFGLVHSTRTGALRQLAIYVPSGILASIFLWYHYQAKGWIGYHPDSPWAYSFAPAGLRGLLRNIAVTAWRLCDQGMIFLWLPPLWITLKKGPGIWSARTRQLLALSLILFAFLVVPQFFYRALLMHRYLFPFISALTLAAFSIIRDHEIPVRRYVTLSSLLVVSGFFWIYPDHISKGWDVMPLHYGYYGARKEMLDKMGELNINPAQTGSNFPSEMPSTITDLGVDSRAYAPLDLSSNRYVLYTNVSNDFTKEELQQLRTWKIAASTHRWPVRFVLYQKP